MKTRALVKRLVEAALLIAISTVLSTLKLIDMPYGGSVSFASCIPVMIIGYRYGMKFGLASAGVYALIQQLLGLENFAYLPVPTPVAIIGLILFDYVLAFLAIGVGCIFRGRLGEHSASVQSLELCLGAVLVCVLRYICHTVAGCTVWQELPIPDSAAIIYSISYNATYMIPETIICALVGAYLGRAIDFSRPVPMPFAERSTSNQSRGVGACRIFALSAWLTCIGGVIADVCLIFKFTQDAESGELTLSYLSSVNWTAVAAVSGVCAIFTVILATAATVLRRAQSKDGECESLT